MSEIQFTGEKIWKKHLRTDTNGERGTILQKNL